MFCILTLDGLRAGEVPGLKWGDIDFDRSSLHIRRTAWYGKIQTAKSEASETVLPIPSSLLTMLKSYQVTWKRNEAGFLFVTRNGRPPSSNKVVGYHLWAILDALGIPRCGLHAFRHAQVCERYNKGTGAQLFDATCQWGELWRTRLQGSRGPGTVYQKRSKRRLLQNPATPALSA
jgi:integrase